MNIAMVHSNTTNFTLNLLCIGRAARSSALRSTLIFTISGVLFALSNLLLARAMPKTEFATFILFFALVQIGMALGPAGIEVIVNRTRLDPRLEILYRSFLTASIIGGIMIAISSYTYNIEAELLVILMISVIAGSANRLAAAHFQSRQHFGLSLCLSQSQNFFMMIAAGIAISITTVNAWVPCIIVAFGYVTSATFGWIMLLVNMASPKTSNLSISWREALTILVFNGALLIMMHIERLIIPKVLSIDILATLGVLMTVAGSPFRMLRLGITFTLLPRFRDAKTPKERRLLLAREGAVVFIVALTASVAVWTLAPIFVKWFLSGKYLITQALVMAVIIAGFAKIFDALASTAVTSIGSSHELSILSFWSWICLAISTTGAFIGAQWGLVGVVYGVGLGWFSHAAIASVLAIKHFRPSA
jgi:O-antigen/teichoic acid export membrane protein